MDDLSVKIAHLNSITINEAQRSNASTSKV
jgi:hypothetical protein